MAMRRIRKRKYAFPASRRIEFFITVGVFIERILYIGKQIYQSSKAATIDDYLIIDSFISTNGVESYHSTLTGFWRNIAIRERNQLP
jgi:hypothetical protein